MARDLRSRKKSKASHSTESEAGSKANGERKDQPRVERTSLSLESLGNYLWIGGLVSLLALALFNPSLVQELIASWLGFSDDAPGIVKRKQGTTSESQSGADRVWLPPDVEKRDAIVSAFKHAWHAYERDAFGADEYHPLSRSGSNLTTAGGIGYTIVDALDTLHIMGLSSEYNKARNWVDEKLTFDVDGGFSVFETTIRVLGGLLSSYNLTSDPLYLSKATDIADRLLASFSSIPSDPDFVSSSSLDADQTLSLPYPYVNLRTGKASYSSNTDGEAEAEERYKGLVSAAEVGTLQLEFKYLSYLTGEEKYWRAVEKVMQTLKNALPEHQMASIFLDHQRGEFITSTIGLGSRADSYYEYLLKQYLQTNKDEEVYAKMYSNAMTSIHRHLIQTSKGTGLTYTSEMQPEQDSQGQISWRLTPKQDHLVCFFGGSLMLGAVHGARRTAPVSVPPKKEELSEEAWRDWETGKELVRTCLKTHDTATGLSPEIVYFRIASDGMDAYEWAPPDWYIRGAQPDIPPPYDARYMLRPETVESLFLAYRLTGDPTYRYHGWKIFEAIEKHAKVPGGGYATVLNVDENPARLEDKMETFFLSETLKYLYLLFSDSDVLPLDKYVFNTEAHPLPIFTPHLSTEIY